MDKAIQSILKPGGKQDYKTGMIMKKTIFIIIMISIIGCQRQQKTLKLAHGLDTGHSVHKAMVLMATEVEERSEGRLKIDIYPSGQLGAERECLELLQIGSLDMTKVSAAVMEGFVEEYKVFGVPYLFRDKQHYYTILDGETGKQILEKGEEYWLRGLCYYDAGSRSFYTIDRPVNHPDDLLGMKIRVMKSITAVKMVQTLGGSPTPISWGELYTALQSGVVDGAENNPPSFYLSHHYEVCKYYSLDEHTNVPDVLLISSKTWNKLSPEEQQWLNESVIKSVDFQRELWIQSEKEALDSVIKKGVTIIYPDKTPFADKVQSMYSEFAENIKLNKLIEDIRKQ